MPDCESVNEVNTPTAYSGISWWVSASKMIASAAERTPRVMIPVENASRSPRKLNWCGR
jgi:hypothetical protein